MMTTQAAGSMIQNYDLAQATHTLLNQGLVLLPTDTLWCIACLPHDRVALERMRRIKAPSRHYPYELLFENLDHLAAYCPDLHPRLETLLYFHRHPLTVLTPAPAHLTYPAALPGGTMAARITTHALCKALIREVGSPLVTTFANAPDTVFPSHIGLLRSDIVEKVDYIVKFMGVERYASEPSVMVQLDSLDEMQFLRS